MYEHFKNEVLTAIELSSSISTTKDRDSILKIMDEVARRYDFKKKELSLTLSGEAVQPLIKTYIVCKKIEGLADGTLKNYYLFICKFFNWSMKSPEDIETNDIRLFLHWYKEEFGVTDRTLDKYREYVAHFFRWASEEGYIPSNPARHIKPIKHEVKPRAFLSQIDMEYLRRASIRKRDLAMVEFFYSTGCRVSELRIVKKDDINWDNKTVHLFGKGRKHRVSYLNARAEVALKEYLNSRKDNSEYLFVSLRKPHGQLSKEAIEKAIRTVEQRTGNSISKHVTPHVLRHTTATTAIRNGMPVDEIQKLLGHKSINTTMIYAKTSEDSVKADHAKFIS